MAERSEFPDVQGVVGWAQSVDLRRERNSYAADGTNPLCSPSRRGRVVPVSRLAGTAGCSRLAPATGREGAIAPRWIQRPLARVKGNFP